MRENTCKSNIVCLVIGLIYILYTCNRNWCNIDYEIKRQKAIEQNLSCEFIRTDPDKEHFDIFKTINKIVRYIKESSKKLTKKTLIDKISVRLIRV